MEIFYHNTKVINGVLISCITGKNQVEKAET